MEAEWAGQHLAGERGAGSGEGSGSGLGASQQQWEAKGLLAGNVGGSRRGRPPRRAARLISMGEGRWRGGAAGPSWHVPRGPSWPGRDTKRLRRRRRSAIHAQGRPGRGRGRRGIPAAAAKNSAWAGRGRAARRS